MSQSENNRNRDFKPERGQESNQNWDDSNMDSNVQKQNTSEENEEMDSRSLDDQTNTTGYGSAQRSSRENVGPLDSDLNELPSQKRADRGSNLTGSGLG
jgi:hypothetical protein